MFRLLGYRFSPRIAGLSDQRFWRATLVGAPAGDYGPLNAIARSVDTLGWRAIPEARAGSARYQPGRHRHPRLVVDRPRHRSNPRHEAAKPGGAKTAASQPTADRSTTPPLNANRCTNPPQPRNGRVAVEQAKGVLGERNGVGMDAAFAALRQHARNHNLKLTALALAVVVRGDVDGTTSTSVSTSRLESVPQIGVGSSTPSCSACRTRRGGAGSIA